MKTFDLHEFEEYLTYNFTNFKKTENLQFHLLNKYGYLKDISSPIFKDGYCYIYYSFATIIKSLNCSFIGCYKFKFEDNLNLLYDTSLKLSLSKNIDIKMGNAILDNNCFYFSYSNVDPNLEISTVKVIKDENNVRTNVLETPLFPTNFYMQTEKLFFDNPFIIPINGIYIMLVGTSRKKKGMILIYESNNLINWQLKSRIYGKSYMGKRFYNPSAIIISKDQMLLSFASVDFNISKIGINAHSAEFFTIIDYKKKDIELNSIQVVDYGFEYSSNQFYRNNNDLYCIGVLNNGEHTNQFILNNKQYANCLSMPRKILINEDKIVIQKPSSLLSFLKGREIYNRELVEGENTLPAIKSKSFHLKVSFENIKNLQFSIILFKNKDKGLVFKYSQNKRIIQIHRSFNNTKVDDLTGLGFDPNYAEVKIENKSEILLDLYFDKYVCEAFFNDGLSVFSLIYFETNQQEIILETNKRLNVKVLVEYTK